MGVRQFVPVFGLAGVNMTLFSVLLDSTFPLPGVECKVRQLQPGIIFVWYITCILSAHWTSQTDVMTVTTIEEQVKDIPRLFPVAVMMQRSPSKVTAWSDFQWQAVGIAVAQKEPGETKEPSLVNEQGEVKQYLYRGFNVSLHVDECESYYHNLMSAYPRCFVVTRNNQDEIPVPFLVTMSFDEAHAYLESDETVYDVDIPPEIYRWIEAYVLTHYVAEKRKKRKRQDWKNQHTGDVKA